MAENKKNRKRTHSPQAGFTLVEVMIAVMIFALGLMAMAGMQTRSVQQATFSDQMTDRVNVLMHFSEALTRAPIMDETVSLDGGIDISVTTDDAFLETNMCEQGETCAWTYLDYDDKKAHEVRQRVTREYPLPNLVMIETEAVPKGISGSETIRRRTIRSSYVRSVRWN